MIPRLNIDKARSWYWRTFQKPKKENAFDRDTYRRVVSGMVEYIMDKVFEGNFVQLSGGDSLGSIGILGRKLEPTLDEEGNIKGLPIAWKKTYELWNSNPEAKERKDKVYCFNENTDGISYNLVWIKRDAKLKNKIFYNLTFCKGNKRRLRRLCLIGDVNQFSVRVVKQKLENA
jgi:hypothetical protein